MTVDENRDRTPGLFDQEEMRQLEADRRHWARRLLDIEQELRTEPERIALRAHTAEDAATLLFPLRRTKKPQVICQFTIAAPLFLLSKQRVLKKRGERRPIGCKTGRRRLNKARAAVSRTAPRAFCSCRPIV